MSQRATLAFAGLVAAVCNLSGSAAVSVHSAGRLTLGSSARTSEWRSAVQAEAEDRRFWSEQWAGLESELLKLAAAVSPAAPAAPASHKAAPAKAAEHTPAKVAPAAAQKAAVVTKPAAASAKAAAPTATAAAPAKQAAQAPKEENPIAGLKLNLNPKSAAELVPTLAMLKSLYEEGKERIGQLNAREKESKRRYTEKQASHEQRLKDIEAKFKNGTLSKEFHTNETHDENRLWNYWEHVRERQRRQFHTSLKIQHATLEKVKTMIDMYEKTIAGTADATQVKHQLRQVGAGIPEVVFLQRARREAASFCQQALTELRTERASLLQASSTAGSEEED